MLNDRGDIMEVIAPARMQLPVRAQHPVPNYSHILVPTSLCTRERPALIVGLKLAEAFQSRVTFLHVLLHRVRPDVAEGLNAFDLLFRSTNPLKGEASSIEHAGTDGARGVVAEFLKRELPATGPHRVNVRIECRRGDMAQQIEQFAEHSDVDLVIVSGELSLMGFPVLPAHLRRVTRLIKKQIVVVRPERQ